MKPSEFRKKRLDLKLSQAALGKLLGVSGHTILRWEQEQTPIPLMAELAFEQISHGIRI
jgi:DNA-binding XRE family transcriptional regulator